MNDRFLARVGLSSAIVYVVLAVAAIAVSWRSGTFDDADLYALVVQGAGSALVGSLLASRRPRNPIGWLFLGAAVGGGGFVVCRSLMLSELLSPGSVPFPLIARWLAGWFSQAAVALLIFSVFLFPAGKLPSQRWRPVAYGVGLYWVLVTVVVKLGDPGDFDSPPMANPFFVPDIEGVARAVRAAGGLSILVLVLATASLVARYRAGSSVERQQLKWIILAGIVMVASVAAMAVAPQLSLVARFSITLAFPTAVTIAILRYRLYDIDHLINRTLVYGVTSAVIAVLFFTGLVALQALLHTLTSGTDLAVAASTLAAFALFQPVRRRVQDAVDRRFDRSRYDAAKALDAFTEDLRDEVDLDDLRSDLIGAVRRTMSPAHASLWLKERGR